MQTIAPENNGIYVIPNKKKTNRVRFQNPNGATGNSCVSGFIWNDFTDRLTSFYYRKKRSTIFCCRGRIEINTRYCNHCRETSSVSRT